MAAAIPAEQATEQAAAALPALALRLLQGLLRLLQIVLQALDAVLRLGQGCFLHEGHLGDAVSRLRVGIELVANEAIGFRVNRRQNGLRRRHAAST